MSDSISYDFHSGNDRYRFRGNMGCLDYSTANGLIYQFKGEINIYKLLSNSINLCVAQKSDEHVESIDIQRIENPLIKFKRHGEKGKATIATIESILETGNFVQVEPYLYNIKFLKYYRNENVKGIGGGHFFVIVDQDMESFYYIEVKDLVIWENYIPSPQNHSIGMIRKEEFAAAAEPYMSCYSVKLNTTDNQVFNERVRFVLQNIVRFNNHISKEDQTILFYGIAGIQKLADFFYDSPSEVLKYDTVRIIARLFGSRIIFRESLCEFLLDYPVVNKAVVFGMIDPLVAKWIELKDIIKTMLQSGVSSIGFDEKIKECFELIINKEKRLIEFIEDVLKKLDV